MADDTKPKSDDCIQVVVRCRPQNSKEKNENRQNIVDIDVEKRTVQINKPGDEAGVKSYTFDGAYDEHTQQKVFYEDCCFHLVENVLEGFNGTVFAYGQTGCGKSYTMQGPNNAGPEGRGVIPNAFVHVFDAVQATTDVQYLIHCSYLEIYNEEIKDLLVNPKQKDPPKCDVKEDPGKGVFVKNLTKRTVKSNIELQGVFDSGVQNRTVASTQMNEESSRSHSIFTIVIEMSVTDVDTGKENIKVGKLNLVDLAGSERQKKTGASGAVLKEGAKINLSLSALGNVISALSEAKSGKHIPYRDSKLTRLLQDSLGGNTKTLMVAAVSPADYNWEETSSTLRYANRAKNIQNKPKINEDPKDTMMRELKEQVETLKKLLEQQAAGGGGGGGVAMAIASAPQGVSVTSSVDSSNNEAFQAEKKEMERALAEERAKHEELMARMLELQTQFTGHKTGDYSAEMQALNEDGSADFAEVGPPQLSAEEAQAQAEAAQRLKDRRKANKAKREEKNKSKIELARLAAAAAEEEMEELKEKVGQKLNEQSSEIQLAVGQANDESRKKMVKLKRKYEKKLQASRAEIDDILEEASYQRSQLLESLREQDRNAGLYEAICLSVMTQRELNNMIERARYDEEDEYWIIPYTKLQGASSDAGPAVHRSVDSALYGNMQHQHQMQQQQMQQQQMQQLQMQQQQQQQQYQQQQQQPSGEVSPRGLLGHPRQGAGSNGNSNSNSNLPGVSAANSRRGSRDNGIAAPPIRSGRQSREGLTDEYGDAGFQGDFDGGSFASGGGAGGADFSKLGMLPAALNNGNNVASLPSVSKSKSEAANLGGAGGKLLGQKGGGGGGGSNEGDDYDYYCGNDKNMRESDNASMPGEGGKKKLTAEEKAKRKAKKAKKMEKEARRLAAAQQHGADDGGQVYTDEAGAGESAGITHEWGWANDDASNARQAYEEGEDSDPAYSDDEDFADENKKNGGGSGAHPPAETNSKSKKAPKRKGGAGGLPAL